MVHFWFRRKNGYENVEKLRLNFQNAIQLRPNHSKQQRAVGNLSEVT